MSGEEFTPIIRPAHSHEAAAVSALAIRSKAHWNYTAEQMQVFRGELTLTPAELVQNKCHVLVDGRVDVVVENQHENAAILGFYTLVMLDAARAELEHIFVDPARLERGLGRLLFNHACETARGLGIDLIQIQSDPNAVGFYQKLGARLLREIPSSIPGRNIPCFEFTL